MKAPWSYVPALPAAVGLVSGILLSVSGIGVWWCSGVAFALFGLLLALKRHYVAMIALFVFLGLVITEVHKPYEPASALYDEKHDYTAIVNSVNEGINSVTAIVTIKSIGRSSCDPIKCRITILSDASGINCGCTIAFKGQLVSTDATTSLPHEVDYNRYLWAEGITCRTILTEDEIHQIKAPGKIDRYINRTRDAVYDGIVLSPVSSETASFLLAALLGDDNLLDNEIYDEFRAIGIAHILALSGLHVGILVTLLTWLLFPLRAIRRGDALKSAITIIAVWGYAELVGMSPSIVRASVMVTVYILARHIQQSRSPFNSLLLSVIVILCINPRWLFTPGFQLSVSAVASILAFGSLIPLQWRRYPLLYWSVSMVVIPIAAMAGTGLISAYYFNAFPGLFLIANILVGALFPWILTLGVILTVFTMCGLDFTVLESVVDWLYGIVSTGVKALAEMPGTETKGIFLSAWVLLPYALALAFLAISIKRRSRTYALYAAASLLCTLIVAQISKERITTSEMYIPRGTGSPCVVMRTGTDAWLFTTAKSKEAEKDYRSRLYRGFLNSRGCDSLRLVDGELGQGPFLIHYPYIIAGDMVIYVAANKDLVWSDNVPKPRYAIVTASYGGDIGTLQSTVNADTLLLAGDMNPMRRRRLIKECGDSVAYKDLRIHAIKK